MTDARGASLAEPVPRDTAMAAHAIAAALGASSAGRPMAPDKPLAAVCA